MSNNSMAKHLFLLGLFFVLVSCAPPSEPVSVTRPATLTATEVANAAVPTLTSTPTALPTDTAVSTPTAAETAGRPLEPGIEATATPRPPNPTAVAPAAIPPEEIAQRVADGLNWTAVPGIEGFPLRQFTGFEYGFRFGSYCEFGPYRWLTDEQLMLFPIVGYTTRLEDPTLGKVTQPIVFNSEDGSAWLPDVPRSDECDLPVWSAARRQIIEAGNGEVRLRDLTGSVVETYPGSMPLFVSPSGQRLLAGQNWIDLTNGELVPLDGWQRVKFPRPAWSSDETEIFECCFSYVNAETAEHWTQTELPGFWVGGVGVGPGFIGDESYWLANDTLVTVEMLTLSFLGEDGLVLPLIDPAAQTYVDILAEIALPDTANWCLPAMAPDRGHLWLDCRLIEAGPQAPMSEISYLVTLPSLEAMAMQGGLGFRGWSADGRFLTINETTDPQTHDGFIWLMDTNGSQWQLTDRPLHLHYWHPTRPLIAFADNNSSQLLFVNAETRESRQLRFTHTIAEIAWQPNAGGVALLTTNGFIFWLADPFAPDSEPVQITPRLGRTSDMSWTPNGRKLALVGQNDFYVIEIATE